MRSDDDESPTNSTGHGLRLKRKTRDSAKELEFYRGILDSEDSTDDDPDSPSPTRQGRGNQTPSPASQPNESLESVTRWPDLKSVKRYDSHAMETRCLTKDSIDPFIDRFGELPKKNTLLADISALPDPKGFCKTCHAERPIDKSSRSGESHPCCYVL